jgi:hypothetical protein
VSIANSCSFCSASWGAIFFEGSTGNVTFSDGSALVSPQPDFGALTVSPYGEWSSGVKNYYSIILNTKTGAASVWNSSDK